MERGRECPLNNSLVSIIKRSDKEDVRRIELQLAEQAWHFSRSQKNCCRLAENVQALCKQLQRRQEFINHLKVYADLSKLDGECLAVFQFDFSVLEQLLLQKIALLRVALIIPEPSLQLKLLRNDLELSALMKKLNYGLYCQPYSHDLKEIVKAKNRLEDKLRANELALLQKSHEIKIIISQSLRKEKTLLRTELSQLSQEKCQLNKRQKQQLRHQITPIVSESQPIVDQLKQGCKLNLQELISCLDSLYILRVAEREELEREYNYLRGRKG